MAAALCNAVPTGRNSELLRSRVANYLVQLYTLQKAVQLTAEQLTAVLALLLTSLQQCSSGSLLQRELVQAVAQVCAHHGESVAMHLDAFIPVRLQLNSYNNCNIRTS
jgi:hypothetical protein